MEIVLECVFSTCSGQMNSRVLVTMNRFKYSLRTGFQQIGKLISITKDVICRVCVCVSGIFALT